MPIYKEPYGGTSVPATRSVGQIVDWLAKKGAVAIQQTDFPKQGFVLRFHLEGRNYRIPVRYRYLTEQGKRQALRWLWHYLKTLLETDLFAPLEVMLLAFIEVEGQDGPQTVGQWLIPQLDHLETRPLLPGVSELEVGEVTEQWELLPPLEEE